MKYINLTQNKLAIVDDSDYAYLSKFKWHAMKRKGGYSACRMSARPFRKRIYMHREIMNAAENLLIDHINHNPLDNRKCNLRICSFKQNRHNSTSVKNSSSKYMGVSYDKRRGYFRVQLAINGKQKELGRFQNEIDAAKFYNEQAIKHYGEFANLNNIKGLKF